MLAIGNQSPLSMMWLLTTGFILLIDATVP
jgi:hypothetical protein